MSWRINNGHIEEQTGNLICILFPGLDKRYARLIRKTPDIMDAVIEFKKIYELPRKMTKKEIDNFLDLIDETKDCDCVWELDNDGDLFDKEKGKICFSPIKDHLTLILYSLFLIFLKQFGKRFKFLQGSKTKAFVC